MDGFGIRYFLKVRSARYCISSFQVMYKKLCIGNTKTLKLSTEYFTHIIPWQLSINMHTVRKKIMDIVKNVS